jgi:benzoyl-CoA reductase/2-hydroxyglutaryl-CoA dehydratase subunit BcrC/BadD/HgdB
MQVFLTSPWVPAEWIRAHGLEPRGIWFAEDLVGQSQPLAAGVCGFANAAVRLAEECADAAAVFTTHCDQLRRGFDAVPSKESRRIFLFNLPATWQSAAAVALFEAEMARLGKFLLGIGGHAPSKESLAHIAAEYAIARKKLLDSVLGCPALKFTKAVARFHWDGPACVPDELRCTQSEPDPSPTALERNGASIPLALLGGPLLRQHWSLFDTIAQAGGRVVLNATEPGERSLWEAANDAVPEALPVDAMHSLARDYLSHCCDVFQRPNSRLYDWLNDRLAARKVRGIVLWHYVGCDLWRAEAQSLREAFGLPVLLLEAPESGSVPLREQGRIEAFLEALR